MVSDDVYSMVGGRWGIMKRKYRGGAGGSFARQGRILSGKEWDRLGKDVVKCVLRSSEMQMRPPCMDWFLHFFCFVVDGNWRLN